MKNNYKLQILCAAAVSLALAVMGGAFLVTALNCEYTASIGHFEKNAPFAMSSYCVLAAAPVLGVVLWVLTRKLRREKDTSPLPTGSAGTFIYAFSAFLMLAASGFDLYKRVFNMPASYNILIYLSFIFGVCGALSLLLTALGKSEKTSVAALSLITPLYFAVRVLILYFDKTVAINCPFKIITQLGLISLMLMFTCDAGLLLGKTELYPRYLGCCAAATVVNGTVATASLVACFMGIGGFELTVPDTLMLTALLLLSAVKLFSAASKAPEDLSTDETAL